MTGHVRHDSGAGLTTFSSSNSCVRLIQSKPAPDAHNSEKHAGDRSPARRGMNLPIYVRPRTCNFIQTSIYEKYSGSMKITPHLDHIRHCKTASGTNWSNRWTYRVFMINTRRN